MALHLEPGILLLLSGEESSFGCVLLFIIGIVILIAIGVSQSNKATANSKRRGELISELKARDQVQLGQYIAGLPKTSASKVELACAVVDTDFIFIHPEGYEVDRIPRDSINQVIVDHKSHITQRLTVTRMATLGIFALAAPKTINAESYILVIDWDDNEGKRQNTIFEFTGVECGHFANSAAKKINFHTMPKVHRLKSGEKKCPFCAETIKAEAIICRHCRSTLPTA